MTDAGKSWGRWLREDLLRSCFAGASLAWLGLGAISIRYALDPYRPNQAAAPLPVYLAILGFLMGSVIGQVYLYRLWWPPEGHRDRSSWGIRWRRGTTRVRRDWRLGALLLGRLRSILRWARRQ